MSTNAQPTLKEFSKWCVEGWGDVVCVDVYMYLCCMCVFLCHGCTLSLSPKHSKLYQALVAW